MDEFGNWSSLCRTVRNPSLKLDLDVTGNFEINFKDPDRQAEESLIQSTCSLDV